MLSVTTEHALRALVELARLPAGSSILGRELARRAHIPANYLAKILLMLRNAGLVQATRGQGGGYRLAKAPEEIFLVQVVDLFEGVRGRPGCFLGESHACTDQEACSAHALWKNVREVYLDFLTRTTIADIGQTRYPAPRSGGRPRAANTAG